MELSVQNVYGLLLRSKLLSLDEARLMFERWNKEAKDDAGDLSQFTRWLVANRFLTEYQAGLLARGHADGFFLNQYKILDRLGRGRMAGVYKAVHQLGQITAIKVLPPSRAKDPHLLARFQREARLALKLKHNNVVRTYQIGEGGSLHYIVMEYLEGDTLEEVLQRRKRLPPAEAVSIAHQALLGLQHIHEQGFVHRDLKPANLMLVPAPTPGPQETTNGCAVKILDIGLARTLFNENGSDAGQDSHLTTEGVLLGTPDYMAPEQARDARSADIRSDIYAIGCVLYHMLAGQPPFPDTNVISQMVRHATETAPPLRDFNAAIPDGLQQIVNWMMAKDPKGRYPTPERAAQALQVFLAAGADKSPATEPSEKMRSYLTWLDNENQKPSKPVPLAMPVAPAAPVAVAAPVAPNPAAAPPASTPPATAHGGRARPPGKHSKSQKRRRSKLAKAAAAAAARGPVTASSVGPATMLADVELVAVPPKAAPTAHRFLLLTRRDLVVFGVGAGLGAIAVLGAFLLASIFGKAARPASLASPPPETQVEKPEN
jgi:serine/threonine protein kinase